MRVDERILPPNRGGKSWLATKGAEAAAAAGQKVLVLHSDGSATEYLPDGAGGFTTRRREGDWRARQDSNLRPIA